MIEFIKKNIFLLLLISYIVYVSNVTLERESMPIEDDAGFMEDKPVKIGALHTTLRSDVFGTSGRLGLKETMPYQRDEDIRPGQVEDINQQVISAEIPTNRETSAALGVNQGHQRMRTQQGGPKLEKVPEMRYGGVMGNRHIDTRQIQNKPIDRGLASSRASFFGLADNEDVVGLYEVN